MKLFGRRKATSSASPLFDFWTWWSAEGAARVTQTLEAGNLDPAVANELSTRVAAIAPNLDWEIGRGDGSTYELCLSGKGDAELRSLAERWLRSAPAATDTWSFGSARRASPDALVDDLDFDGVSVAASATRVGVTVDEDHARVHVQLWNPVFDSMGKSAYGPVFLFLDWILGEDGVEKWIGAVEVVDAPGDDFISLADLPGVIDALATRHSQPTWTLLQAENAKGIASIATVRRPLRWIDHPLCDLHTEIVADYPVETPRGLPTPEQMARLQDIDEALHTGLDQRAQMVGHETSNGRRVFHVYSDSQDQNITDGITALATSLGAKVRHSADPGWRATRHLA